MNKLPSKIAYLSLLLVCLVNIGICAPAIDPGQKLDLEKGKEVYQAACARCHDSGKDGAPKLSSPKTWNPSSVDSFSTMENHAKNGFLAMPAEGPHSMLSDQDLANAVFYISNRLHQRP